MGRVGQGRAGSVGGGIVAVGIALSTLFMASPTRADWKIYVAPGLGISRAIVDTDGRDRDPNVVPPIRFGGSGDDSSPVLAFAVGLEIPMDELVPREWLLDVRLPSWPVRIELEAAGLRDYEIRTDVSGSNEFFTEITATTTFVNFWLDIPLVDAYRPVQYVFGLGRQPGLRRWLEPASFYLGPGIGFSAIEIDGTDNVFKANDDPIGFAWNFGFGLNYALTDRVSLNAGYRFVGLADHTMDLDEGQGVNADIDYQNWEIHEFRFGVKIKLWEFRSPWR